MTNYERIKNMSIEEMVESLLPLHACSFCVYEGEECLGMLCKKGISKYLESEVEDDA